jgi:hypothetical protein
VGQAPTLRTELNTPRPVGPHASEISRADVLFDAIVDAGLRHDISWTTVKRLLDQLPDEDGCPYCGGRLDRWAEPSDDAWRCAACGRLHFVNTAGLPTEASRARAAEIGRAALSWRRAEGRIIGRSVA